MLTLFSLTVDRYRRLCRPGDETLPIKWVLTLVWAISVAVVLPYSSYITFIDLSVSKTRLSNHAFQTSLLGMFSTRSANFYLPSECTVEAAIFLPLFAIWF